MTYSLKIKRSAVKELATVSLPYRRRIADAIDQLKVNPHRGTCLKGDLTGWRRIRVGDYRVIYEVDEVEVRVLVVRVAHRREVYR
ncbi:MAG: type II toxin-antitoxin system RelE/ParE family toxin [Gammaproteobacteria bacterium]|nr:MAG: type II toxin-antitoxin system RelE/ParE family toxin [Gammaproteobacteria bacterium]